MMEPYLGDMADEPIKIRQTYKRRFDHPRWIERGVQFVITTFGITVGAVLLAGVVLSFFLNVKKVIL